MFQRFFFVLRKVDRVDKIKMTGRKQNILNVVNAFHISKKKLLCEYVLLYNQSSCKIESKERKSERTVEYGEHNMNEELFFLFAS